MGVPCGARLLAARRGGGFAGARALSAPGRGGGPHARRPAWAGGADEARRAGCGTACERRCHRRGRAGLVRVVDRVMGSVLPAPTVRQGGDQVQCAVRRGSGKRGVASRDDGGGAGAAGGDVRGERGTREGEDGRMTATHVLHWLWGGSRAARVVRVPLIPLAGAYWAVMKLRAARGRADAVHLPLPTIAIGNLSIGGTGKAPLAAWIAAYCVARGRTPGILLRGYGGDEPLVHRRLVPQAVVGGNPGRVAGAVAARAPGAPVLVLGDAYPLLGGGRGPNIAGVSAGSATASPSPLTAGAGGGGGGGGGRRSARCGSWSVISRVCDPARARSLACSLDGAWWRLQGSPTRRASRNSSGRPARACNSWRTKTITRIARQTWSGSCGPPPGGVML